MASPTRTRAIGPLVRNPRPSTPYMPTVRFRSEPCGRRFDGVIDGGAVQSTGMRRQDGEGDEECKRSIISAWRSSTTK